MRQRRRRIGLHPLGARARRLEKFYAPLFASVGCKLTCTKDDLKVDRCDCPKAGSGSFAHDTGYVHLQPYDQAYQLFFAKE